MYEGIPGRIPEGICERISLWIFERYSEVIIAGVSRGIPEWFYKENNESFPMVSLKKFLEISRDVSGVIYNKNILDFW